MTLVHVRKPVTRPAGDASPVRVTALLVFLLGAVACGSGQSGGAILAAKGSKDQPKGDDGKKEAQGDEHDHDQSTARQLQIRPQDSVMTFNASTVFVARVAEADGTLKDVTQAAIWSLPPDAPVQMQAPGQVRSLDKGAEGIKVSASFEGLVAEAKVSVKGGRIVELRIDPTIAEVKVGATSPFRALAKFEDGSEGDVSGAVQWSSADPAIANFYLPNTNPGEVKGLAAGNVAVKAQLGVASADAQLSVKPQDAPPPGPGAATLLRVVITPPSPVVDKDKTLQLIATAYYSNNTDRNVSAEAIWSSSSVATATVSTSGVATGKAVGVTDVTARLNDKTSDPVALTVRDPAAPVVVASIKVTPASFTIDQGGTKAFAAIATLSNGATQPLTPSQINWSSSNTTAASVSTLGVATGVNAGYSEIRASLKSNTTISDKAFLTVRVPGGTLTDRVGINLEDLPGRLPPDGSGIDYNDVSVCFEGAFVIPPHQQTLLSMPLSMKAQTVMVKVLQQAKCPANYEVALIRKNGQKVTLFSDKTVKNVVQSRNVTVGEGESVKVYYAPQLAGCHNGGSSDLTFVSTSPANAKVEAICRNTGG